MKFSLLALLPVVLAAPFTSDLDKRQSTLIPNKWIITLNSGTSDAGLSAFITSVTSILGAPPTFTYNMGDFKGIAITAPDTLLALIRALTGIAAIEQDATVSISDVQNNPPYGLARISHRAPGATTYNYDGSAGTGTYAYIIDTGINLAHVDFGGRATFGANFAGDGNNNDGNGHGTHVAGTTGSNTYGVAKKTNLIAVKVLNAQGSGSNSGVIAGINYAANDAKSKGRVGKAVGNLSLGGSFSTAVNNAVTSATNNGLFLAVAAGNSNANAANYSPSSATAVCTVGATDASDNRASFSNYGSVLDVFAPGVNILSTWIGSTTATNTISGTSMASPHVAGLGAYLLALEGARTPAALCDRIKALATKNVVKNPGTGSPNNLAFNGISA